MNQYTTNIFSKFGNSKNSLIINFLKISIIIFISIYLIGNFSPYYDGWDTFSYGLIGIDLAKGDYGFTNSFLQETGFWEFIPIEFTKTVQNSAIPIANPAMFFLVAGTYAASGIMGLFYLGPIMTILFLISSERIATKLFNDKVGLLTLFFLATNSYVIRIGQELMLDNIFSLLSIIAIYFLIRYLHTSNSLFLLFTSLFFTVSTFFRINGIFYLPFELFIILSYFPLNFYFKKNQNYDNFKSYILKNFQKKKFFKNLILLLLPWIVFLGFWFSYNDYFFGDPFLHYENNPNPIKDFVPRHSLWEFLEIDTKRVDNIKGFSQFFLPYPISGMNEIPDKLDSFLSHNWLGFIPAFVFLIAFSLSLKLKKYRFQIFTFFLFYVSLMVFYSSTYIWDRGDQFVPRYMFPMFPLFFMILSWLLVKGMEKPNSKFSFSKNILNFFRIFLIIGTILFFVVALYFSEPIQATILDEYEFHNPFEYANKYPLDLEGITHDSVIIDTQGTKILDYGAIPFNPYWKSCCHVDDVQFFSTDSIKILVEMIQNDNDVFVFKDPEWPMNKFYFNYLANEYDLIFSEYSNTFCKISIKENNSTISDQICL